MRFAVFLICVLTRFAAAQQPPLPNAERIAGRALPPTDLATATPLTPVAIAVAPDQSLYVAEGARVWRVDLAGKISVVPSPSAGYQLIGSLAADSAGVLYVADFFQVWRIGPDGTVAPFFDGLPLQLRGSFSSDDVALAVAVDPGRNLYISDRGRARVWKVTPAGVRTPVAGTGLSSTPRQDQPNVSVPALQYDLYTPGRIALDPAGNLYVHDEYWVHKITPSGTLTHIFGTAWSVEGLAAGARGTVHLSGHFLAAASRLGPQVIALDAGGERIVAGSWPTSGGSVEGCSADRPGVRDARKAFLSNPRDVAFDAVGNLYIADSGNGRVRRVAPDSTIATVAGGTRRQFGGDGGPASDAFLSAPAGLALDGDGNLYVADRDNNRIRRITAAGFIDTIAGAGPASGEDPDCVAPNPDYLLAPSGVAVDPAGALYIADTGHNRVLKRAPDGTLSTVSTVMAPLGVAVDSKGRLYVAQSTQILRIDISGAVESFPSGSTVVAADPAGNIYAGGQRIVKITPLGDRIEGPGLGARAIAAGPDLTIYSSGLEAKLAALSNTCSQSVLLPAPVSGPRSAFGGLAVSGAGDLFLADSDSGAIWRVPTPVPGAAVSPALDPIAALNVATRVPRTILVPGFIRGPFGTSIPAMVPAAVNEAVAPGERIAIKGLCLAPMDRAIADSGADGFFPTSLAGARVTFDGVPAPVISAQSDEIVAVVPYEIAGRASVQLRTEYGGSAQTVTLETSLASPGLFRSSSGDALVLNQDGALNTSATPAVRGSIITAWATGEGLTDPAVTGKVSADPLAKPALPVSVAVGSSPAEILYAGAAPGFIGLMQITLRVPENAPPPRPLLTLTVGPGSNAATFWVR
jgi:uncharacterized protein (TIGR03437 family)